MAFRTWALAIVALVGSAGACSSGELGSPDAGPSSGGGRAGSGQIGGTTVDGAAAASGTFGSGGAPQNCPGGGGTSGGGANASGTGSAGLSGNACCVAPSNCLAGLCGNGVRDACSAPTGPGSCPVVSLYEPCDGADLGGESCTALGYGSGALACYAGCTGYDTTGCYTCVAGSPSVAQCNVVSTRSPGPPSMAATDTETALAWIEQNGVGAPGIGFALLSSALAVSSSRSIAEPAFAALGVSGSGSVQIAALPSGWLVLATTDNELSLHTLDSAGNEVAHSSLDPMSDGFSISAILTAQPNGGPLVVWQDIRLHAAVVSADGRSTTTPVEVLIDSSNGSWALDSATFAAGAFHALVRVSGALDTRFQLFSISPDGTVAGPFSALPGMTAPWGARLVSGADDLRVVYEADCGTMLTDPCLIWQRMSATGAALSSPVVIDASGTISLPDAAVALGADTYLSAGQFVSSGSSVLIHLAPDGTVVGGATPFAIGGSEGAVIVRRGSDLVAGWMDSYPWRMEVARLTP